MATIEKNEIIHIQIDEYVKYILGVGSRVDKYIKKYSVSNVKSEEKGTLIKDNKDNNAPNIFKTKSNIFTSLNAITEINRRTQQFCENAKKYIDICEDEQTGDEIYKMYNAISKPNNCNKLETILEKAIYIYPKLSKGLENMAEYWEHCQDNKGYYITKFNTNDNMSRQIEIYAKKDFKVLDNIYSGNLDTRVITNIRELMNELSELDYFKKIVSPGKAQETNLCCEYRLRLITDNFEMKNDFKLLTPYAKAKILSSILAQSLETVRKVFNSMVCKGEW